MIIPALLRHLQQRYPDLDVLMVGHSAIEARGEIYEATIAIDCLVVWINITGDQIEVSHPAYGFGLSQFAPNDAPNELPRTITNIDLNDPGSITQLERLIDQIKKFDAMVIAARKLSRAKLKLASIGGCIDPSSP